MHALQMTRYGPAEESLKYVEIKTPAIENPNDILVKVKAVGINPVEAKYRAGNIPDILFKNPPNIIGSDYAGIVVAKGSAVKDFEIGDEVYGGLGIPIGQEYGAYAEYVSKLLHGLISKVVLTHWGWMYRFVPLSEKVPSSKSPATSHLKKLLLLVLLVSAIY